MDTNYVIYLGRYTLETALLVSAPLLIVCMVVGTVITLLQAVTALRDMTLTIVPKLLAMGIATLVFGNWMLEVIIRFTSQIFSQIQNVGR